MGITYDIKSILKHLEYEIDTLPLCVYNSGEKSGYQGYPNIVCLYIHNSGDNQECPKTGLIVCLCICNSENKLRYQEYSQYLEHQSDFIPTTKRFTVSQDTK